MGTVAVVRVYNEDGTVVMNLLKQCDGIPKWMGKDLRRACLNVKLINGITDYTDKKTANGMECLAARIVAKLKKRVGGFYLVSDISEFVGDYEWVYDIYSDKDSPLGYVVSVYSDEQRIFKGCLSSKEFLTFCKS